MPNRFTLASMIGVAAIAAAGSITSVQTAPGAANTPAPVAATPPTSEETFVKECGACHIAYPAGFLSKRSWQAIIEGLAKHFDEDASLDDAATKTITEYLLANAADAVDQTSPALRDIKSNDAPLRITETPFWRAIHHEVNPAAFDRPGVKSPANCLACHGGSGEPRHGD